jgi:hypothetical protein
MAKKKDKTKDLFGLKAHDKLSKKQREKKFRMQY